MSNRNLSRFYMGGTKDVHHEKEKMRTVGDFHVMSTLKYIIGTT